jgi:hypothetical protein
MTEKGALMNTEDRAFARAEVADEVSKWTVGLGTIVVALFPLSIPILLLTAVALLPLVLPVIAVGLVVAIVALPVLLVRRLVRVVRGSTRVPTARGHRLEGGRP